MKTRTITYNKKETINVKSKIVKLMKTNRQRMVRIHQTNLNKYNVNVINSIIYNEKEHIVAEFKDYLIYDDFSEFLKRYYRLNESVQRIPKITDFYENYSKIFPNYTNIPEAKYMYKNIKKKQKVIDTNHQQKQSRSIEIEDFRVINTEAYESIMNQTQKCNDSKTVVVDESAQSLEGIIDVIGNAEKMAVFMDNNRITTNPSPIKDTITTSFNIANSNSNSKKNPYNFHLDLKGINSKNLNDNFKQETKVLTNNNNKIIINQIDELQKLQLKVNAGLINSDRNSKKDAAILEIEARKKSSNKTPKQDGSETYHINANNYASTNKLSSQKMKEYHQMIQNTKSARNSKNFEIIDLNRQDKTTKQQGKEKLNLKDVILEEEVVKEKQSKDQIKGYHKSTISMPKLPSSTIYNNYNIINNFQNIILPNESTVNKNSKLMFRHVNEKKSTSNNKLEGAISNINKLYTKNFSKDLEKIRQNVKKIINEYNFSSSNRFKDKSSALADLKQKTDRNYPLSARNEKDPDIIKLKSLIHNNEVLENQLETDRVKFSTKKLINEILSDSSRTKNLTRNINEKGELDEKSRLAYLTSSINFDKPHATISHQTSRKKLSTVKDMKTLAKGFNDNTNSNNNNPFSKLTGKMNQYPDQVLKSQHISPSMIKGTMSAKKQTQGFSKQGSINNNTIKGNGFQINPSNKVSINKQIIGSGTSSSSKVNSNYGSVNNTKVNNYLGSIVGGTGETGRKAEEVKKMLKIKNFYEITKIKEVKAYTDRNHYDSKGGRIYDR